MYYFDNAATSYPKPEEVYETLVDTMKKKGGNPGRGSHSMALEAARAVYATREKLAALFNIKNPLRVAFTYNATMSLNFAIKGILKRGDHVITTSIEHNSVLRPIFSMEDEEGVEVTVVEADEEGRISLEDLRDAIKENTKALIMTHISNLTGSIMPVEEAGEIAKEYGATFILDASQSAGVQEIDVEKMNIDILCFTGHKSLFGPQGTGGIYVREGIDITPLMEGGSGSNSKLRRHPREMPDLLESGTQNAHGIAALGAGVDYILKEGMENIRRHEYELTTAFIKGIRDVEGITIYGPLKETRGPIVSLNIDGVDPSDVSAFLDEEYRIAVRPGMHCAPLAHRSIGTYNVGAVRFSFGYFNTMEEITYAVNSLKEIAALSREK